MRRKAAKHALNLCLQCRRQDDIVVGVGRPVEGEQIPLAVEGERDRWLERRDEGLVVGGEPAQRPRAHVAQRAPPRGVDGFGACFDPGEEEVVRVAHDDGRPQRAQARHHLGRLRPALDGVAQAHELRDRLACEVGEHRVEPDVIAMHIREDCDAHPRPPFPLTPRHGPEERASITLSTRFCSLHHNSMSIERRASLGPQRAAHGKPDAPANDRDGHVLPDDGLKLRRLVGQLRCHVSLGSLLLPQCAPSLQVGVEPLCQCLDGLRMQGKAVGGIQLQVARGKPLAARPSLAMQRDELRPAAPCLAPQRLTLRPRQQAQRT